MSTCPLTRQCNDTGVKNRILTLTKRHTGGGLGIPPSHHQINMYALAVGTTSLRLIVTERAMLWSSITYLRYQAKRMRTNRCIQTHSYTHTHMYIDKNNYLIVCVCV